MRGIIFFLPVRHVPGVGHVERADNVNAKVNGCLQGEALWRERSRFSGLISPVAGVKLFGDSALFQLLD